MDGVSGQNKVSRFKTIITTITLPAAAAMPTALLSSPHDMAKEEEEEEEERERCKNEIILEVLRQMTLSRCL